MRDDGLYLFDDADAELTLLPMAARRALDLACRHLSLQGWQTLELAVRRELTALGAAESVDVAAVAQCLARAGQASREVEAFAEPSAALLPPELSIALGSTRPLTQTQWSALHALDRYVLVKHARRGKHERLQRAYDEIVSAGTATGPNDKP